MNQLINDPHYSTQGMEERVRLMWLQLKTAQLNRDTRFIKPFIEEQLLERCLKEAGDPLGDMIVPSRSAVLQLTVSDISVDGDTEYVTCFLKTKYRRFRLNVPTGKSEDLDRRDMLYDEKWSLRRPLGTRTPAERATYSVHCAQCGAAAVLYRDAVCPFCGAFIKVPDFTWTVYDICVSGEKR